MEDSVSTDEIKWNSIHSCHANCQNLACVIVREAVAAEREACAKVCDERKLPRLPDSSEFDQLYNQAVSHCAKAIRARGKV